MPPSPKYQKPQTVRTVEAAEPTGKAKKKAKSKARAASLGHTWGRSGFHAVQLAGCTRPSCARYQHFAVTSSSSNCGHGGQVQEEPEPKRVKTETQAGRVIHEDEAGHREDLDALETIMATTSMASGARGARREAEDVEMRDVADIDLHMFRRCLLVCMVACEDISAS